MIFSVIYELFFQQKLWFKQLDKSWKEAIKKVQVQFSPSSYLFLI